MAQWANSLICMHEDLCLTPESKFLKKGWWWGALVILGWEAERGKRIPGARQPTSAVEFRASETPELRQG